MTKAFHYTSVRHYEEIKLSGVLYPNSRIIPPKWEKKCPGLDIPDKNYIFSLLESRRPESWTKLDIFDYLVNNYFKGLDLAILSFEIVPEDDVFILEVKHTYELWKKIANKKKQNAEEAFRKYLESKIPLKDYKFNYEIPELIVGNAISEDRITLEGTIMRT